MVMADMGRGTKLLMMRARPEILPTVIWLGRRKKYTAAAQIMVPAVIIKKSDSCSLFFIGSNSS